MATLSETAALSRLTIKFGSLFVVGVIVGRITIPIIWKIIFPPQADGPNYALGQLTPVAFPDLPQPEIDSYELQTASGQLPVLPKLAQVFAMPKNPPDLLAIDRARAKAQALGFEGLGESVTETKYRWQKKQPLPSTLTLDIYTDTLRLDVEWTALPTFLLQKNLPAETEAVLELKSYLKRAQLVPDDLTNGESKVTYLKATEGELRETVSLSEADFLQIDLYRAPVLSLNQTTTYQVVTPDPKQGIVRGILSGNQQMARFINLLYHYFPVTYDVPVPATYPLKSTQQAWDELESGGGYIGQLDQGIKKVIVRRVELAYLDTYEPQAYLQPVFLFRGDNNFIAYVEAVSSSTPPKR